MAMTDTEMVNEQMRLRRIANQQILEEIEEVAREQLLAGLVTEEEFGMKVLEVLRRYDRVR